MARRSAFEIFLRTGRRVPSPLQFKFNPWHDPEDGKFTFANQGNYFPGGRVRRDAISLRVRGAVHGSNQTARLTPAQFRTNPRVRLGGNGGPSLYDPQTLEHVFPGLSLAPGGAIIALADNIFDFGSRGRELTTEMSMRFAKHLEKQIRAINPDYRHEALDPGGFPSTAEGQTNLINKLRADRAKAFYDKGELRPLQVEILRFLQRETDAAFEAGAKRLNLSELPVRLSQREALGNYVDRQVRFRLRERLNWLQISTGANDIVRVNSRAPNSSERSYSIPDSRVGSVAFDVSLTRKTIQTRQVRQFFRSDFQPDLVVIVRPSGFGPNSTYAIARPKDYSR